MKHIFTFRMRLLIIASGLMMLVGSCSQSLIRDAAYPEQLIYMPAATYNNYIIDAVPKALGSDPTPGFPTRFTTDTLTRKFNVLLAAYRSGITMDGTFKIDVSVNKDTINKLLAIAGQLPLGTLPVGTLALPVDKFTIPSSIEMLSGKDIAKCDLAVDLDFLRSNYQAPPGGQLYAVAVTVSSTARKTNPKFATTIIVINTKIMKPTAGFTTTPLATNSKNITFNNASVSGVKFIWNFGDGTPVKVTTTEVNEVVSHIYSAAGTYNCTLTTIGLGGYADKSVLTKPLIVL